MSPEIYKKLVSYRKRAVKEFKKYEVTEDYQESVALDVKPLLDFLDTGQVAQGSIALKLGYPIGRLYADVGIAHQAGDQSQLELAQARYITQSYLAWRLESDFVVAGLQKMAIRGHAATSNLAMMLLSIGWEKEAREVIETFWTHLPRYWFTEEDGSLSDPLPVSELFSWFSSYFILGSQDLIKKWNQPEPDAHDTAHSHLLGRWNEPDGSALTNLMTAYSEQNVVRMLLPESKRTPDFDPYLMPYCAYDLTAIQMRRKLAGLDPIPLDDPRMTDHFFDYEEAPLVQDDLIWPCYLKACADNGISPYEPRKTVQAKTDRATLEISLT